MARYNGVEARTGTKNVCEGEVPGKPGKESSQGNTVRIRCQSVHLENRNDSDHVYIELD